MPIKEYATIALDDTVTCEVQAYVHGNYGPSPIALRVTGPSFLSFEVAAGHNEAAEIGKALLNAARELGWVNTGEVMAQRAVDLLRRVSALGVDESNDSIGTEDDPETPGANLARAIAAYLTEIDDQAEAPAEPENPAPDPYAVPAGDVDLALKPDGTLEDDICF